MFKESLAIYKKMLGDEHPDVADSLNNLASLYKNQGKYDEAEKMFKESLAMRKKMLGEEHPDVAQSLNNLAALYENQGKYDEAEKMFEESLLVYCTEKGFRRGAS